MIAVILAGGLGSRLKPFTEVIPKPLLPMGESTVLEIQISHLIEHGAKDIFIATYYKADYLQAFLGDGSKYGVSLTFSKEDKPLGTCGPLSLLKEKLTEPFILMNGDVLTTLNIRKAYDFALKMDSDLTVITKKIRTPFEFGRVISEKNCIVNIEEKPVFNFEVLSGIYILKPPILKIIPENTYYGIDLLIKDMLAKKRKVSKYLMEEYWIDIGRIDDFQLAQERYKNHF